MVQITFSLWLNYDIPQNVHIYPEKLHAKKKHFMVKLDYSMTKVYDGHANKEFNKKLRGIPGSSNIILE